MVVTMKNAVFWNVASVLTRPIWRHIPKMAYFIYLIDCSKCTGIKILTTVIKQKYKIWIGRTELQL
jgi:hypothetical protein